MLNTTFRFIAIMAIAFLILIQKDETGDLLVNGHRGLAFVVIMLIIGACSIILHDLYVWEVEDQRSIEEMRREMDDWIAQGTTTHRIPTRSDYRSSDLERLVRHVPSVFQHEGSFESLNDRHQ